MEENIMLKRFENSRDFPYFARLVFDEAVMKQNMGRTFTQEEAEGYFAHVLEYNLAHRESGTYQVFSGEGGAFLGICSLWVKEDEAEAEYMVLPEYWGRGYATEMLACLVQNARQIPSVKKIRGLVDPENIPSKRVLAKNGFALESRMEVPEDHSTVEVWGLAL